MSKITISDIQEHLARKGESDAKPYSSEGMFLEISFGRFHRRTMDETADDDFAGKIMTVESDAGSVTITFDEIGFLYSIDIS